MVKLALVTPTKKKPQPAAEKKDEPKLGATAALMKSFKKEYGEGIGSVGGHYVNSERIPTGVFELDLTTGGGFPRGRCSIIFGKESSCKTNIAYLALANHQRLWPDLACSFVDIEHSFDPKYAKKFGIQLDKLNVLEPMLAEEAVDITEALLSAEDCGLVVVDSLAAMLSTQEFNQEASKANVGGSTNPIGKMYRKTSKAMGEASTRGHSPSLIYINQIRNKIGMFVGNPETQPGGNAPLFQASMILRVWGGNVLDNKINPDMPVRKHVRMEVRKWKVPIFAASAEFEMAMIAHNGLKVGQTDSYKMVKNLLEANGMYEKGPNGKGWMICGELYPTQAPFEERFSSDRAFADKIKADLIEACVQTTLMDSEGDIGE